MKKLITIEVELKYMLILALDMDLIELYEDRKVSKLNIFIKGNLTMHCQRLIVKYYAYLNIYTESLTNSDLVNLKRLQ